MILKISTVKTILTSLLLMSSVSLAYAANETTNSTPVDSVDSTLEINSSEMSDRVSNTFRGDVNNNDTVSEPNASESIDKQINQLKSQLNSIKVKIEEQNELVNINDLLSQLTQLEAEISDTSQSLGVSKINTSAISQHITEVVKLSYHIGKAKQVHETYLNNLTPVPNELEKIKQRLDATKQLLINPINQSNTLVSYQNIGELIANTETLQAQLESTITQERELITKSEQAISSLESLQGVLIQTIENRSEDADTPASSTDLIKQKIVTHEIALAQLRAELAKDKNQKTLPELQELQTEILIKQHELWLYSLDNEILQSIQPLSASLPIGQSLSSTEEELNNAYNKAVQVSDLIDEKIEAVTVRQKTLKDYTDVIGQQPELMDAYQQRLDNLNFLKLQIDALQTRYDQRLTKRNTNNLFTRKQVFKDTDLSTYTTSIPESLLKISYQIKISVKQLLDNIAKNPWQIITVLVSMVLIVFILKKLSGFEYGRKIFETNKDVRLIVALRKVALAIKKHQFIAMLSLFIAMFIHVIDLSPPSYHIIVLIVSVVFSVMLWFSISSLNHTIGIVTKREAWQSNIAIVFLAVSILLYGLSSLSAVSQPLVDFYEKVLMVVICVMAWQFQGYLSTLQANTNDEKHFPISNRYFSSHTLFFRVLPVAIIIVSLLGIIGFTQLSWIVLNHMLMLLFVVMLFSLGVLCINTVRKQLKLASIKRYERGVFFVQDIINPISLLAKIIWFLLCGNLLIILVSIWQGNNPLYIYEFVKWLFKPLFSIHETSFSLFSIIMIIAAPFIIYHIGKWLRSFTFHWLFFKVSDYGIRHSLSIFSQYVAILIGSLITLKIVGLDLTSFAVFAGALGVGVGLGLQDIAKNFISGILLLIERPLRQGDWVMIDGNEGFVKSIGLRTIVLENFDKQEVIIPNGNAVNNSLTNFTHSDKLNRTVLYVGVSYDCEPDKVHRLIGQILTENEAVLSNPGWEIILWEYADSAINYRIQYHIDLNQSQRFYTQDDILKRIWYVFKDEGVEIPYPQRDVYIKNTAIHEVVADNATDMDMDTQTIATKND